MYSRPPATSPTTMEEYAAASPPGTAHSQITLPSFLFSATMVALLPPGQTTTASPSTSGDSAYAHDPGLPLKSLRRLFVQTILPLVSRHAKSPSEPKA